MHAKPALDRIALIDECNGGRGIATALANAGYDVAYARPHDLLDGDEIVVRVSAPGRSGIVERRRRTAEGSENRDDALETRARNAEKMDAIARLAGGIAHDFNNLLSVIAICADDVLEGLAPNDVRRTCIDDIRDAVERGSILTRDLLTFGRAGVEDLKLVDFNALVSSSHRLIERVVGEAIQIETALMASAPHVRIDPNQWSSVFVNLALNARSAMPRGGMLRLRTQNVLVDPAQHGHEKATGLYVELEVADTGCGMTDDVRTRIFEPFFTTKGLGRGTGLGLSVIHGIVEQSGGWIEVTSTVGVGTAFRIYLPAKREAPVALSDDRSGSPATSAGTLLVVEDEEAVRRIAARALHRSGYRVFQAGCAEEALVLSEQIGRIDLLVTDVVLPGMNGRRLADVLTE
ncbi:MAG TPA: ATP-binding protein, partial [Labilithrix sp.]|nr:ATP-binding protein [Labilithrix sp.]